MEFTWWQWICMVSGTILSVGVTISGCMFMNYLCFERNKQRLKNLEAINEIRMIDPRHDDVPKMVTGQTSKKQTGIHGACSCESCSAFNRPSLSDHPQSWLPPIRSL